QRRHPLREGRGAGCSWAPRPWLACPLSHFWPTSRKIPAAASPPSPAGEGFAVRSRNKGGNKYERHECSNTRSDLGCYDGPPPSLTNSVTGAPQSVVGCRADQL